MPAERGKPDSKGLSWFDINDFSPGIYDASATPIGSAPNTVQGPFPAPPGAADASNTYGCIAEPNGGLGPMPAQTATNTLNGWGLASVSGAADITGLVNTFVTGSDELLLGVTVFSGSTQNTLWYSYVVGTNALNLIDDTPYTFTGGLHNYCCYPFSTMMIDGGGNYQPVVVLPLTSPAGTLAGDLWVYPALASPGSFSFDDITQRHAGITFGHQGRVVQLQALTYSWPVAPTVPFPNEAVNYTDPPLSETFPVQFEEFGPENPFGYGAVNSVSAGELFMVKVRGGAIIVQGDLNNPTVTSLPGVRSTGYLAGRSDVNQNGMYYCVFGNGAWAWNGGNTSQKISQQLDDGFYVPASRLQSPYYSYFIQRWNDWMLFSNNWVLDSLTGGWWRLSNPAAMSFFWYVPGFAENVMYAALGTVTGPNETFFAKYDRGVPNGAYNWQSLPIRLPSEDRLSDIREVVVRASNPYLDSGPTISPFVVDSFGNTTALEPWTMSSSTGIQEQRFNCGVKSETVSVVLSCVGNSGTPKGPVIHSLAIGYRSREHVGPVA